MGLVDTILCEVEIPSWTGGVIETEPNARRRAQYSATMQVPAVKWIVQITIRGVVAERETAPACRNFAWRRTSSEANARRDDRYGQNAPAKIAPIEHRLSSL